ncbi:MAG: hypothetical protein EOO29_03310 [Comamonadaceae bacterium]|nr:MAG: hypothetical protein EOO29_03310 [Comamonadaceae bacterium]
MKKLTFTALLSATLASLTMLAAPAAHADDDHRGYRDHGHGYQTHPGYHHRHAERQAREYRRAQREYHRRLEWQQRHAARAWQAPRYDRDGDGVPNRYDRRPGNPYRY